MHSVPIMSRRKGPAQIISVCASFLASSVRDIAVQRITNAHAGVFKAWVLAGTQVYATPLHVPRSFYINSALGPAHPNAQGLGSRVSRTLPHGHQPLNVYQVKHGT